MSNYRTEHFKRRSDESVEQTCNRWTKRKKTMWFLREIPLNVRFVVTTAILLIDRFEYGIGSNLSDQTHSIDQTNRPRFGYCGPFDTIG